MIALILLMIGLIFISCEKGNKNIHNKKDDQYFVQNVKDNTVIIDGVLNDNEWEKAEIINNFTSPWEKVPPQHTEFRALYDSNNFYFSFSVSDTQIVIFDTVKSKKDLIKEDRVEVYFAFDNKLAKPYYCVEIDSRGRRLDYLTTYPNKYDFGISWGPINSAAVNTENGYSVEASISLDVLKKLGFKINGDNTKLNVGLFRADKERLKNNSLINHWQVWVDPNIPKPNFHVPMAFGYFIFEGKES